jgi:benzodiazapine receptor
MSFDAQNKPWFQPPDWVFGPVWTFLYASIGLSFFMAYQQRDEIPTGAFLLFAVQIVANLSWTPFFNESDYANSLSIILVILFASIGYALLVYPHQPMAAWLFVPYILWVAFATIINVWYYLEG